MLGPAVRDKHAVVDCRPGSTNVFPRKNFAFPLKRKPLPTGSDQERAPHQRTPHSSLSPSGVPFVSHRLLASLPLVRTALFVLVAATNVIQASDDNLVRLPDVVYDQPAGKPLHLDYVRPQGEGPFPLVVCIHGGGWRQGSRTDYKDFQTNMAGMGVATASVQYRFAPEAKFPAQLEDIRSALKFVLADSGKFRADAKRVLWMGGSAGGHLALLAGLEPSQNHTTKLIVNVAGPTDLRTFKSLPSGDAVLKTYVSRNSSELLEDLLGTSDRKAAIYATASPVTHLRAGAPRIVTCHGEKDDLVPIAQAEALHEKLHELKASELLIRSKSGGHDFGSWETSERTSALIKIVEEIKTAIQ